MRLLLKFHSITETQGIHGHMREEAKRNGFLHGNLLYHLVDDVIFRPLMSSFNAHLLTRRPMKKESDFEPPVVEWTLRMTSSSSLQAQTQLKYGEQDVIS